MAVRLKDIAEKTGYSINTVSRVINNSPNVSPKTRETILSAAKDMGYVQNIMAKSLRTGCSNTIALIIDDLINPFFSIITDEMSLYAAELGYTLNIYTSNGNIYKEKNAIDSAVKSGAAGIILCPMQDSFENVAFLKKINFPHILILRTFNWFSNLSYVVYDEARYGFVATEHLILKNCKHILCLVYDTIDSNLLNPNTPYELYNANTPTLSGIINARSSYGMPVSSTIIRSLPLNIRSQKKEITSILSSTANYDAVFCSGDIIAYNVCDILGKQHTNIPIIGFGNTRKHLPFSPNIITAECLNSSISIVTIDALLNLVNSNSQLEQHTLPIQIIDTTE